MGSIPVLKPREVVALLGDSSACVSAARIDSFGMPTGVERLSPSTLDATSHQRLLRKIARDIGITVEELLDRR